MKRRESGRGMKSKGKGGKKMSDAQYYCSSPADPCLSNGRQPQPSPPVYILSMTPHGVEYPFG